MNKYQRDVHQFHYACGIPIGESEDPKLLEKNRMKLRKELIKEEGKELRNAYEDGDMVEIIDGSVDSIVVILGGLVEMGIDLDPFWDEVHRTNMAKKDGPMRPDGKQLKPEGWTPPDLAGVLKRIKEGAIA